MAITLTEKAATEVKVLIQQHVDEQQVTPDVGLRLAVEGGGCSGFMYKMAFDEKILESDRIQEIEGIKIVCDSKSYLYLDGTELDFRDDELLGRGFVFNNPNASGTCGCGSSFAV